MLEDYVSQRGLVERVLTVDELSKLPSFGKPVNIMMGQTFDVGQPVDMMKYALFLMGLKDLLTQAGATVNVNWLIADHFMVNINQDVEAEQARRQVEARVAYLTRLNQVYGGDIGFVLSSELSQGDAYQTCLKRLKGELEENAHFRELVLKSIPEDRRTDPGALEYPLEELATIQAMDTRVKVGPTYEVHYDEPAREFAPAAQFNRYVAIHLTNAWPFSNPALDDKLRAQIEAFGVLPYKKDSKGLGAYRIDPLNEDFSRVEGLIQTTTDSRALRDLLIISHLADQRLSKQIGLVDTTFPEELEDLRKLTCNMYREKIHVPLRGG